MLQTCSVVWKCLEENYYRIFTKLLSLEMSRGEGLSGSLQTGVDRNVSRRELMDLPEETGDRDCLEEGVVIRYYKTGVIKMSRRRCIQIFSRDISINTSL
ncbi:hypothetical protein AVEN_112503-1 [Araneus ventricosus]|uniref:Uncharacterized protein n=1 Tax=Araneus ventricosus TaxID=182803 RepID=A0A4Y2LUQ8_ARAVE|nr:hypothetical protein AVEN_112503-1 [Araneus ventricosus]